jgi:hypothetical protein
MVHVFRLGPITLDRRPTFVYAAVDEEGTTRSETARTDAQGLRKLADAAQGQPLRCEPSLAKAGKPFGFESAPLPEAILFVRAALAYGLALGPKSGNPDPDVLGCFLKACGAFWRGRAWNVFDPEDWFPVTISVGGSSRACELAVLGSGGEEFGVALYDEPGSVQRITRLLAERRMAEVRPISALAVTFDEQPPWAVSAIEDAFGLPRLPVPLRVKDGKGSLAGPDDLLAGAALLEAVARFVGVDVEESRAEGAEEAEATVEAGGQRVTAHVRYPTPEEMLRAHEMAGPEPKPELAPASAKTPRNAPCPCGSGLKYKKCHLIQLRETQPRQLVDEPTCGLSDVILRSRT